MSALRRVIAIVGPTAAGKTSLAVRLASLLPLEVVSADARQVYRMLDIGTAKPTALERAACLHHCIDTLDPDEAYSAAEYARDARIAIDHMPPSVTPFVVGGSGLYLRAALDGFSHDVVAPEPSVREALQERLLIEGKDGLYDELVRVDPRAAQRYADKNPVRVLRALEFFQTTGRPFSSTWDTVITPPPYDVTYVGVTLDRPALYAGIDRRCDQMWQDGLVAETQRVLDAGISPFTQALQTVGYTEAIAFLRGTMSADAALAHMQQATRNYAKRQLTWFKRDERITWFDGHDPQLVETVGRHLGIS
jgi:tRNA dimethylallyltransferase